MDSSPGRVYARLNTTNANPTTRGLLAPRGQGQSNGFDVREVTCYGCHQKGHMIHDCPQHTWNQTSTRGSNTFRGRFNSHQGRQGTRSNARSTYVDNDTASESLYYDAEQGQGDFTVASATIDDHTDEQKAKDWLGGVAAENDNIKDMVLQDLWKNEDFLGA